MYGKFDKSGIKWTGFKTLVFPDPIFTVSGPVDHYKAAIVAKMSSIKFVSS